MQLKKLETKAQIEKRDRRRKMTVGILLALIMILSVLGYAGREEKEEKATYGGYTFTKQDERWYCKELGISTLFLPQETENISAAIPFSASDFSEFSRLYFSALSPAELQGKEEIAKNLQLELHEACLEEQAELPGCENLPLKNCSTRIIVLKELKEGGSKIYTQEQCIFIEATANEMLKAADKFLFGIYLKKE